MHNPVLKTQGGTIEALSNLCYDVRCTVIDIEDAVEDSSTSEELLRNINNLKLFDKFSLDRETDKYVRLISVDCWGNKHYLVVQKD